MLYEVCKPIPGTAYQPGDLVTGEGWRTLKQLVAQRYLSPRYETAPVEVVPTLIKTELDTTPVEPTMTAPVRRGRGH